MAKSASESCVMCGTATTTQCSGCKAVHYCSTKCQKLDRPLHKLLCDQYLPFLKTRPANEPGDGKDKHELGIVYTLAILLPIDKKKPEFMWMKWRAFKEYGSSIVFMAQLLELDNVMQSPRRMRNGLQYGREIDIYIGETSSYEPTNKCVAFLNQGYKSSTSRINVGRNHVITSIHRSKRYECTETYKDINLADLRHDLNYYGRNDALFESDKVNSYYIRNGIDWAKAVIISCSGDMKFSGKPKYRQVSIFKVHHIYIGEKAEESPICHHLDLPYLVMNLCAVPSWSERAKGILDFDAYENPEANCLMMHARTFGLPWTAPKDGWNEDISESSSEDEYEDESDGYSGGESV